ncbi:unnamed protein product [Sphenostylis stenocarpa]|uniref:Uncharacterized protein n=1 Tax=Sphenostylis stenocarpa TaxID=92480 RepID=A0AA86SY08_9FABA|nr:unnamed protein product [Sphenostylis stenocarpa]
MVLRKETPSFTAEDNFRRKFSLVFSSPDLPHMEAQHLHSLCTKCIHCCCASVSWLPAIDVVGLDRSYYA